MGEDPKPEESAPGAVTPSGAIPSRLPPDTQFARYRIVREVGSGGMGCVYEAVLVDLNKRVALKVLSRDLAERPEHRERFMREGRAAARIRHPNVVEIFDVGEHDGQPFLAMAFLVGNDLRAHFDKGPLPVAELLDLAMPVLAAVVTAHDAQVVHRDLKPENIFLNEHPGHGVQPMVLDFGISKVLDDATAGNLTATSTMVGTPLYMSPEQVRRSREVDPRTDQYALGVVLYEGLTGVCAFTSDSLYDLLLKKVQGDFAPLRTHKPELPEALCAVIERAMAADRDQRYPNVRAFATELLPFARERTRALWSTMFNAKTGDELSPQAIEAAAAIRADSTLRSSVRDLPAVKAQAPASAGRRYLVPAILLMAGAAAAIALGISQRTPPAPIDAHTQPVAMATAPVVNLEPVALPPAVFTVRIAAEPPTARIVLDGAPATVGTLTRELPKDGKPHTLEITAEGFEPKRVTFTDAPPDESEIKLVASIPQLAIEEAPAQPLPLRPRTRDQASQRKPSANPQTPAGDAPKRRNVGSNDAPVLY
jgi:hypothetical protein